MKPCPAHKVELAGIMEALLREIAATSSNVRSRAIIHEQNHSRASATRRFVFYIRQSTPDQLVHNLEEPAPAIRLAGSRQAAWLDDCRNHRRRSRTIGRRRRPSWLRAVVGRNL